MLEQNNIGRQVSPLFSNILNIVTYVMEKIQESRYWAISEPRTDHRFVQLVNLRIRFDGKFSGSGMTMEKTNSLSCSED